MGAKADTVKDATVYYCVPPIPFRQIEAHKRALLKSELNALISNLYDSV